MAGDGSLRELQALSLARPGADAPESVVAAWYRRKARVLEGLAQCGAAELQVFAAQAAEHAARLGGRTWDAGGGGAVGFR